MPATSALPISVWDLVVAARNKILLKMPFRPMWDLFLLQLTIKRYSQISDRLRKKAARRWTRELEEEIRTTYRADPESHVSVFCDPAEAKEKLLADLEEVHVQCVRSAFTFCIYWGYTKKARATLLSAAEQFEWKSVRDAMEDARSQYMTSRHIVNKAGIDLKTIESIIR
jgi:hypothetical protein